MSSVRLHSLVHVNESPDIMRVKSSGARVAPSHYPRNIFHGLRCVQLISSIIVSGIMCYFMYYLHLEHFAIPWTFILLLTISIATVASLFLTIILYNFTYLSPKFNLVLNGFISLFWALGFALLTWGVSSSNVLGKQCTGTVWGGETAAGACRDFKALWSFTLLGTVSTFSALALDFHTQKKATKKGIYVLPEDDNDAQRLKELQSVRVRSEGYEAPREQSTFNRTVFEETDIAYHNQFGAPEAELNGPFEHKRDIGYHDEIFDG